ncbi:MAG: hypothetical protein EKK31_11220 [Hyphomicrobiales bacterium]|nr:MAG: hypothetical protein EKK31_11220 [Hyphomicrobiales bacterium]
MKISELGPRIVGRHHCGEPMGRPDHFLLCPACGQAIDLRDLRQVIWHQRPAHGPLELDA